MPSIPGRAAFEVESLESFQASLSFCLERSLVGFEVCAVLPDLGSSKLVHLSLFERAPTDGQRRICVVLELCRCAAFARHARLLTDHRREVKADPDGARHGDSQAEGQENKP